MGAAWIGAVAFAFQLYFDFSGYSDMAVGLGRILGFRFLQNFDAPFRAESITELWQRWHISLSTWLRDYLYVPLGGNRKGPRRTYLNLAITMLLGGLWHGAEMRFVVWGGLHGAALALERALGKRSVYGWLPRPGRILATFVVFTLILVFFRAESVGASLRYLGAMFGVVPGGATSPLVLARAFDGFHAVILVVAAVLVWQPVRAVDFVEPAGVPAYARLARAGAIVGLSVASIVELCNQGLNPFLYFRF